MVQFASAYLLPISNQLTHTLFLPVPLAPDVVEMVRPVHKPQTHRKVHMAPVLASEAPDSEPQPAGTQELSETQRDKCKFNLPTRRILFNIAPAAARIPSLRAAKTNALQKAGM